MAAIAVQQSKATGVDMTFAAASGGGDTVAIQGSVSLFVRNGDASAKTVTIVRPGNDEFGLAIPDITHSVPAGATARFKLEPAFKDPSDGLVDIAYSAVTSVTVCAMRD